jgi:transcriptional regulator with XRE-family HTH domain
MSFRSQLRLGLARALRAKRVAQDLPQEAIEPQVTRRYVSSLESGSKSPTVDTLQAIAYQLGTRPSALLLAAELLSQPKAKRQALLAEIVSEATELASQGPVKSLRPGPLGKAKTRGS